jgi:hypothetical protein
MTNGGQRSTVLQGADRQGGCLIRSTSSTGETGTDKAAGRSEGEEKMKTLQEKIKALPAARRKKIQARTDQLIREEMTLRELRKAKSITQAELARVLNVNQEQVSRLEQRTDLHISTLRRQIEAMGGELMILASFPNLEPIKLVGIGDI